MPAACCQETCKHSKMRIYFQKAISMFSLFVTSLQGKLAVGTFKCSVLPAMARLIFGLVSGINKKVIVCYTVNRLQLARVGGGSNSF